MSTFKDKFGHVWNLSLDLETAWKIEEYDFAGRTPKVELVPPTEEFFTSRITDPKVIFGMAWIMLRDEFDKFNAQLGNIADAEMPDAMLERRRSEGRLPIIDESDFASRLDGNALKELKFAMWEEIQNFFPEMATMLRALTDRFSKVVQVASDRSARELNKRLSDSEIERMVEEGMAKAGEDLTTSRDGNGSTPSPQSSAKSGVTSG